jgi:hypothetical protein
MRYLIWIPTGLLGLLLVLGGAVRDSGLLILAGLVIFVGGGIWGVLVDERRKRT